MDRRVVDGDISEDEALRVHLLLDNSNPEKLNGSSGIEEGAAAYKRQDNDPAASAVTGLLLGTIFVACCGSMAMGCSLGYTSSVESAIMSDLSLTTSQFSLFGSLMTVGALMGSLITGKVTDYIGRRRSSGLADVLCIAGWILIASSEGVWSLYLGRLLVGSAAGFFSYVNSTYLSEIAPKNHRGAAGIASLLAITVGVSLTIVVGLVVNWRVLALLGSIPCITQFIGLFFVPESPRWLLKYGQLEEYEKTIQNLRGYDVDVSLEVEETKEFHVALQNIPDVNVFQLFERKYAYALLIVVGLMALSQGCGAMGILFYASYIFEAAGLSATIGSVGLALMQVVATIVGLFLIDKVGRRVLLLTSASGMSSSCMLVGLSFFLKDSELLTKISPYIAFFGVVLFFVAYSIGMGGVPFVVMSELFPMNAKGAAGSIATMANWSTSWVVTYSFNFLLDWTKSGTFFIFAGVNAFTILFVTKLVPETKERSLEEIQESTLAQGEES